MLPIGVVLHRIVFANQNKERQRTEHGFALQAARGTILRGWTLAIQDEIEAGLAQMHQGLAAYQGTRSVVARPRYLAWLAEVYGHSGRPAEGLHLLAEGLVITRQLGLRGSEPRLYWLQGELLLQMGTPPRLAEAEASLLCACDLARSQQAKSWELRAAMSLCRLWHKQGKQQEAEQVLAEAYGWFTEGFNTSDLKEAKTLLNQLGIGFPDEQRGFT